MSDEGHSQQRDFVPSEQRGLVMRSSSLVKRGLVLAESMMPQLTAKPYEEVYRLVGHTGEIHSVVFSPNGHYVLSGSMDRTVRLWDVTGGQESCCFGGHTNGVMVVAFSPNGYFAASGDCDGIIRVWKIASRQELHRFEGQISSTGQITVAFSPNGTRFPPAPESSRDTRTKRAACVRPAIGAICLRSSDPS